MLAELKVAAAIGGKTLRAHCIELLRGSQGADDHERNSAFRGPESNTGGAVRRVASATGGPTRRRGNRSTERGSDDASRVASDTGPEAVVASIPSRPGHSENCGCTMCKITRGEMK